MKLSKRSHEGEVNEKGIENLKKTILIVDDEHFVLELLSDLLEVEYQDSSVITADNAEEAEKKIEDFLPHLVLVDKTMPGKSGLELLRWIKEKFPSVHVIMVSSMFENDTIIEMLTIGAAGFIYKPFIIDKVIRTVNEVLGESDSESEITRLEKLVDSLRRKIEIQAQKLERSSKKGGSMGDLEEIEKYRAICGAVAHNLKGEFVHIGSSLEEIRSLFPASAELSEESDVIERSLNFSRILLQRLLDFLETGGHQLEEVDVLSFIKKVEEMIRPRLRSNVDLKVIVAPDIAGACISSNQEQLMGVLLELINNSTQAIYPGTGSIELGVSGDESDIVISVKDDGPGIPPELREHLFKAPLVSKSGSGIGLFLSRKVIGSMGWRLELKETSARGTTFVMTIPANE